MPNWLKRLDAMAPRHSGMSLDRRIYDEILVKGEQFTRENADDFKENIKLLGELIMAHGEFREESKDVPPPGLFKDMFSEYLIAHEDLNVALGQIITPYAVVDYITQAVVSEADLSGEPQRWLDPAAGTGRFMLGAAKHYAEKVKQFNFIFTNIDIDFRMFVYCTTNAVLHGIPSINVWGNTLLDEVRECIATIPILPGFAQWRHIAPERAQKMVYPPRSPHGQQALAEFKSPVSIIEVKPTRVKEIKKEPEREVAPLTKFFKKRRVKK